MNAVSAPCDATARSFFTPRYLPWLLFALSAVLIGILRPFPSLSGDEYGSLEEARDLTFSPGVIGYFVQLRVLLSVTDNDCWLRSLSLLWAAVSVWALQKWLELEPLAPATRLTIVLLWVTNPF